MSAELQAKQAAAIQHLNERCYVPAFVAEFNKQALASGLSDQIADQETLGTALSISSHLKAAAASKQAAARSSTLAKAASAFAPRQEIESPLALEFAKLAATDDTLIGSLVDIDLAAAAA